MVMAQPSTGADGRAQRLGRGDWARAALAALATGGVRAVAVEPLAAELGATKGSFYWHFRDRAALVEAALELWERQHTAAIIALMDAEPDPAARLRALFALIVSAAARDRVELPLLSHAQDPAVRTVLERVTARRISYVAEAFTQLGFPPDRARRRALLSYATYLGHLQLRHATGQLPDVDSPEWDDHLAEVLDVLLADAAAREGEHEARPHDSASAAPTA